jgi:hypothetical protein
MTESTNQEPLSADAAARTEAAAREVRRDSARVIPATPLWYEAAWLGIIGALVVAVALPFPLNLLLVALLVSLLNRLMSAYRNRYGLWISGFRPGRTRRIAIALSVLIYLTMVMAWFAAHYHSVLWPVAAGALGAVLLSWGLSRAWMRALRHELENQ